MLSNISWLEYLLAISLSLAAYYALIGLIYYGKNIQGLLSGKTNPAKEAAQLEALRDIVIDIRYAILEKAGPNTSKPELLIQFGERLESFNGLRVPAFRVALNNHLIRYSNEICGVDFSEDELNGCWDAMLREKTITGGRLG